VIPSHTNYAYQPMERIKERLSQLRLEADNAVVRAEEAEAKIKKLEQELLTKDQDIQSLNHRLTNAEGQLDAAEDKLKDAKNVRDEHDASKSTNDGLQRKIQLLEEELDRAEKTQKETTERLRQVDLKAEHFERQVQTLEQERDKWEKKYEETLGMYQASKKELDELVATMDGL
jgi:tropomyosin